MPKPITIVNREGEFVDHIDVRTFARAFDRGEIAATGTPLTYKLIAKSALVPVEGNTARRRFLEAARK